jgi:hypothetical protein
MNNTGFIIFITENENSSAVACFDHFTVIYSVIFERLSVVNPSFQYSIFSVNKEFFSSYIYASNLVASLSVLFEGTLRNQRIVGTIWADFGLDTAHQLFSIPLDSM